MKNMNIVDHRRKIASIVERNDCRIGEESRELEREFSIDPADVLEKAICSIEDDNRLLQIGIVGRVKAGKSSLLNALLFDGKNILPKAATPMTAALTQISYGDELCAEVEFFSKNDIEEIKKDHQEYTEKLKKLIDEKMNSAKSRKKQASADSLEKSRKQAQRELGSNAGLSSAYDQYERMKSSGVAIDSLKDMDILSAKDIHSLSQQLLEYVGSEGRYMPFTKSVHIKLPQENLQGIQIVDTPGLNDPVQSREDRTRELLKYCDVIFIVSPSGQFLSKEDTDLMDRITIKEGVNNIFVISSQIDNQLMGDEKDKGKGDLHQILKNITKKLGEHLSTTLTQLKKNSPEVGTTFDQLIEQGQKCVIHSSGICQTLRNQFDSKELWDSGARKVWENLTREYPDYFSDSDKTTSLANLDLLSNLGEISKIIAAVQVKKQEIIEKRKEEFIRAKTASFLEYKERLIFFCKEKLDSIRTFDREKLNEEKKQLEDVIANISGSLDNEYYSLVENLVLETEEKLSAKLNGHFRDAQNSVTGEQREVTDSYAVSTSSWYNPFSWGDKENRYSTYTEVRSGSVVGYLEDLTKDVEASIKIESKKIIIEWRDKKIKPGIIKVLRNEMGDDNLESRRVERFINNAIRTIRRIIRYVNIEYDLPSNLKAKGVLKGYSAESFIDDVQGYISGLKRTANRDIGDYVVSLSDDLRQLDICSEILDEYKKQMEELEEEIKEKEINMAYLEVLIYELKGGVK